MSDNSKSSSVESAPIDEFMLELQGEFLNEASFLLEACEESYLKLENPECRADELGQIFRAAHSFKGTGASVGLTDLAAFAHKVEDCLSILRVYPDLVTPEVTSLLLRTGDAFKERVAQLRSGSSAPWRIEPLTCEVVAMTEALQRKSGAVTGAGASPGAEPATAPEPEPELALSESVLSEPAAQPPCAERGAEQASADSAGRAQGGNIVKVEAERIDRVLELVGELMVTKSQLTQSFVDSGFRNPETESLIGLLDQTVRELQDRALGMRMTPMKPLFRKIQRAVRDLALKLGKSVVFASHGEDVEIDRGMIDLLGDPLIHIARNAVDHGIEKPGDRAARGKAETATITMSARQAGGRILIEIRDDGAGIDRERVIRKALERGVLSPDRDIAMLPQREVNQFLFAPGFSTAEVVSDISGRGVGLDVVRSNVEKLRGTVDIESEPGKGSVFRISIPLTAAITDGMLVLVKGERFILPLDDLRELIQIRLEELALVGRDGRAVYVRNQLLPLVDLQEVLLNGEPKGGRGQLALVIDHDGERLALQIDQVVGQVQVVVKPIQGQVSAGVAITGTAILGDGRVALVLDSGGLIRKWRRTEDAEVRRQAAA